MPFVRDQNGHYHAAGPITDVDILTQAAAIKSSDAVRERIKLSNPKDMGALFSTRLKHLEHEEFHVAFLDTTHRLIAVECLFSGTVDGTEVHPREVVKRALAYNAACIAVAHNHPSKNPEPSAADRAVTARLKQAMIIVDIRLLDHFVIAGDENVSLAARGWI